MYISDILKRKINNNNNIATKYYNNYMKCKIVALYCRPASWVCVSVRNTASYVS